MDKIAFCDAHEDAATMGANALHQMMKIHNIPPNDIHRIYVGTESAVDSSKPIATYIMGMMEQIYGQGSFSHCDSVDIIFACIGGVDALQNSTDWVRLHPEKKAVVITTDFAKYEMGSAGEYTQGAGAMAMLISSEPRIVSLEPSWGVSCMHVFDFFKPRRRYTPKGLAEILLSTDTEKGTHSSDHSAEGEEVIEVFKETPIFQGQYSNQCYEELILKAFLDFKKEKKISATDNYIDQWSQCIFHLPYPAHGKRIFMQIFALENQNTAVYDALKDEIGEFPLANEFENDSEYKKAFSSFVRRVSRSATYTDFVEQKIAYGMAASTEIGNMYTSSIFMSLLSYLTYLSTNDETPPSQSIGLFSYGSGAKSKVFEGQIVDGFNELVKQVQLFESLSHRTAISYAQYQALHLSTATDSVVAPRATFALERIETEGPQEGARHYQWVE